MRSLFCILVFQAALVMVSGQSILAALQAEDIPTAIDLIGDGVDPNEIEESSGWTPLIFSTAHGELDLCRVLILAKADLDHQCNDGWTALMFASHFGHEEIANLLLEEGADAFLRAKDGRDAHFIAKSGGFMSIAERIEQVLRQQQHKRMYSIEGIASPLHVAVHQGDIDTMRQVLSAESVNAVSDGGWTPLILAAAGGHMPIVKELLENGADASAADRDGWTALMFAAHQGYVDLVALLMDSNADSLATNSNGQTASDIALLQGSTDLAQAMYDIGLCNAIAHLDMYRQRIFISRGVACHISCYNGHTPLIHAAKHGLVEDVQNLLECGAHINGAEDDGWTPVMFGVVNNHPAVVELLLQRGADTTRQSVQGHTVYNIAETHNNEAMLRLLKNYANESPDAEQRQQEQQAENTAQAQKKSSSWSNLFGLLG